MHFFKCSRNVHSSMCIYSVEMPEKVFGLFLLTANAFIIKNKKGACYRLNQE